MNGGYVELDRGCVPKKIDSKRFGMWPMKAHLDILCLALLGGTGFWGAGFEVVAAPNDAVSVTPGAGMVLGAANAELPSFIITELDTAQEFTPDPIVNPDNARIDLIVMRPQAQPVQEMRDFKNLDTGAFSAQLQTVGYRFGAELGIQKGVEAEEPDAPAVPSGWVALAEVQSVGVSSDLPFSITDRRRLLVDADALAAPAAATAGTRSISVLAPVRLLDMELVEESGAQTRWYAQPIASVGFGWWKLPVEHGRLLKTIEVQLSRSEVSPTGNDVIIRVIQIGGDGYENILLQHNVQGLWTGPRTETITANLPVDLGAGEFMIYVQLGAAPLNYRGSAVVLT